MFPSNIVRIKDSTQVLSNCQNILVNFSFSSDSQLEDLGVGSFQRFSKLYSVDLTNCKRLLSISRGCFSSSTLKYIILPEEGSLVTLSGGCFSFSNLLEIKIPSTVQTIERYINDNIGAPFTRCYSLEKIEIPHDSKLSTIGYAIAQFSNIAEFFIPENTFLEPGALNTVPRLSKYILHENNTNYKLYNGILYTYDYKKLFECPCKYDQRIEFHPDCDSIETEAFRYVSTPYEVIIPSKIKSFGSQPFLEFNNNRIIFEDGIEILNSHRCFWVSNSEIILPESLKNTRNYCFQRYYGNNIEFFSNIELIDTNSFVECPYLVSINNGAFNKVCTINNGAFNNCPMLKLIIVAYETASLLRFESSAFINCPRLRYIKYTVDMQRVQHHFTKGFFSNSTQLSITSPHNSSCGSVHVRFPNENVCNIIHFCTSSCTSFFFSKSIFPIHPFISL